MSNTGVESAMAAARAIGARVALPGLDCKADIWDLWDKHGPEITRERILAAKTPGHEAAASAKAPGPCLAPKSGGLPDPYFQNEKGLYFQPAGKDKNEAPNQPIRLGPPLEILARTRDGQSGEWGLLLAWKDPDGVAHKLAMPYAMLTDSRQLWATLAAGGYISAPGREVRRLIEQLLAQAEPPERARCVPSTGWNCGCLVLPDAVYGESPELLVVQGVGADNPYRVSGDLETWKETIGAWCRGNSRLTFSVAVALAGPVLPLVGMEPGAVHIYGHSSSGKSTLLRAAWSVWGGPEGLRTWRATANALEGIASIHADTLLALDEIGQADLRALDEAAYLLLNGRGKMRANVDGSSRATRAWSLMVLSTGEPTLADRLTEDGKKPRAGQEVRLVDIPADAGQGLGAWENIHDQSTPAQFSDEIKAACAKYHGTLGRAWAQYLAGHQGEAQQLRSVIRRTAEHWATGTESGQVVRVAERFALIGLAGELAAQAGLVPWTEGQSLSAANSCLLSWLAARGGGGDTEDIQAVSTVQGFIARYGASRFQTIGAGADDITPSNPHERIVERAGFRRTTLSGEEQFIFTKEQWSELFRGRNPLQAARAMDRAGLLIRNDGSLAQKVALPDLGRVRAYVVRIAQQNEEPAP